MRYSIQKENIKNGLEKHCIHPTAEELYVKLRPDMPNLSLATVYRNLNKLADKGEIKRIEGLSGQVHFDHNNSEHFHVICVKCGKVADLFIESLTEQLSSTLKTECGYELLNYDIIVKGLCSECKDKK